MHRGPLGFSWRRATCPTEDSPGDVAFLSGEMQRHKIFTARNAVAILVEVWRFRARWLRVYFEANDVGRKMKAKNNRGREKKRRSFFPPWFTRASGIF